MKNFLISFFLLFSSLNLSAQEFAKEVDKLDWVKKTFNDQRMFDIFYREGYEDLGKQVMHDFIHNKDIETIEPIAKGNNINDPNIAKYNLACPNEKPINLEQSIGDADDPNKVYFFDCLRDMRIFKVNPYNETKNEDIYILNCRDYSSKDKREWWIREKRLYAGVYDSMHPEDNTVYLVFNPNKCNYSKSVFYFGPPNHDGDISGIFRHQNRIYFYKVYENPTFHDVEEDVFVDRLNIMIYTSVNDEIKAITSAGFVDKKYHPFPDEVLKKKFEDEWQRILDVQEAIINKKNANKQK